MGISTVITFIIKVSPRQGPFANNIMRQSFRPSKMSFNSRLGTIGWFEIWWRGKQVEGWREMRPYVVCYEEKIVKLKANWKKLVRILTKKVYNFDTQSNQKSTHFSIHDFKKNYLHNQLKLKVQFQLWRIKINLKVKCWSWRSKIKLKI